MLLLTCIFVVIYTIYNKYIVQLAKSFVLFSAKSSGLRDARSVLKFESLLAYVFFCCSYGTFFYMVTISFFDGDNTFSFLFLCSSVVAGVYFVKHCAIAFSSWLLPFKHEFKHYELLISTTNKIIGIYIIPFLFIIGYTSDTTQLIGTGVCAIGLIFIYLYRVFISLRLSLSPLAFHKFHFFLYLCTIEIAPFIILLKLTTII